MDGEPSEAADTVKCEVQLKTEMIVSNLPKVTMIIILSMVTMLISLISVSEIDTGEDRCHRELFPILYQNFPKQNLPQQVDL